jgi:hypothetical protein
MRWLQAEPFTFIKGAEREGCLDCAAGDWFGGLEAFEGSLDAVEGEEKVCCSGADATLTVSRGDLWAYLLGGLRLRRRC